MAFHACQYINYQIRIYYQYQLTHDGNEIGDNSTKSAPTYFQEIALDDIWNLQQLLGKLQYWISYFGYTSNESILGVFLRLPVQQFAESQDMS